MLIRTQLLSATFFGNEEGTVAEYMFHSTNTSAAERPPGTLLAVQLLHFVNADGVAGAIYGSFV